jgi:hypothetical protein
MSYRVLADSLPQQVWTAQPDGALNKPPLSPGR